MPSVQVKNVPDDVHRVLRRRAAEAGQSLQEYLLHQLVTQARQPSLEEVLARIGQHAESDIPFERAAALVREERDAR